MKSWQRPRRLLFATLAGVACLAAQAQEVPPGAFVETLLAIAKESNPDYAGMRYEAQAALERVSPAGAFPDPRFRLELMDITKGGDQNPSLWPGNVGATRYLLMQDLPWFGKRDLKRDVAQFEAKANEGQAMATWSELAARIKSTFALRYYHHRNQELSREVLDLMTRLEMIAQARYASGLAVQQDVIRAQIEQTNLRSELVQLEGEGRQIDARLNALMARPASAPLSAPRRLRTVPKSEQLDFSALQERVLTRNPLLFSDESRIRSAEKNRDLTYKNRYPDVTLGISPTQTGSSVKDWTLMVEFNIPLQQGTKRAQERESQSMLLAAQARHQARVNQVLADLSEQLAGIEVARQTGQLATTSLLPQAELTFNAALVAYENGKVDFATLLDAQRQIRQAKLSQSKAQYEAQVRLAEIEKLLGEEL